MTEKRIIEITKLDGYKVHCLYEDGEPRVIDFKKLFDEWVSEGDGAYPLTQSLEKFQNISLSMGVFQWQDCTFSVQRNPNYTQKFCYELGVLYQTTKKDEDSEHLGSIIEQFANEITEYCQPENEHEYHKAVFILLIYIIQEAFLFYHLSYSIKEYDLHSFKQTYLYILKNIKTTKEEEIRAFAATLKDKIVKGVFVKDIHRRSRPIHYENGHSFKPIYVQGIKKAIENPDVNALFGKILLLLGRKETCDNCTYEGHFLHGYKYRCNEIDYSGMICPQCYSWSHLGVILEGVGQVHAFPFLYEEAKLIHNVLLKIGGQNMTMGIPIQSHPLPYPKLKNMIADIVNNNICVKKQIIQPSWFEVIMKNGEIKNSVLNLDTETKIKCELIMNNDAPRSLEELESTIMQETTDIDW